MAKRVCVRLLFAGALLPAVLGHVVQAQSSPVPRARVRFVPAVTDHVSGLTWTALTEECERIWKPEGVDIEWDGDAVDGRAPDVVVPLVFDDREVEKSDRSKKQDAFGITVFFGRTQRVLVSVRRVRQLIAARRKLADSDDSTVRDHVAGLLLGRVVAHELGHVLLLTTAHAATGLMSPYLTERSSGPVEPGHFALTAFERYRIATRFSVPPDVTRLANAATPNAAP